MMQAGHGSVDSVHHLVMDLHKRMNALQAEMAQETLDGAAVYDLELSDHPMVSAFMAGVNRTARLKFNHPGLAAAAAFCMILVRDPRDRGDALRAGRLWQRLHLRGRNSDWRCSR